MSIADLITSKTVFRLSPSAARCDANRWSVERCKKRSLRGRVYRVYLSVYPFAWLSDTLSVTCVRQVTWRWSCFVHSHFFPWFSGIATFVWLPYDFSALKRVQMLSWFLFNTIRIFRFEFCRFALIDSWSGVLRYKVLSILMLSIAKILAENWDKNKNG